MATIDVKDANNATQAIEKPLGPGRANAANSKPMALSTEDKTSLDSITTAISNGASLSIPAGANMIGHVGGTDYETVVASASDQIMGASGALSDFLAGVLIIPATTSPGAVTIKDGNGAAITIFAGGTNSVTNLVPFFVPLGVKCVNATTAGWKITTGAAVTAIGVGDFT